MRFTYIASDNSTGNATGFNNAGQDCFVKKIIFGAPADGKITNLYNKATAYGHASGMGSVDTSDIAFRHTQPTAAAGKPYVTEVTFSGEFNRGLQLDGGAIHTDASQVTVIWDDQ